MAEPAGPFDGSEPQRTDLGRGAFLEFVPRFVLDHAQAMQRLVQHELQLEQETIRVIAREVPVPRLVAFCGEPGKRYRYSGRDHEAAPWTPTLRELVEGLRARTGTPYDTVLCNFYRDGNDAMGRHADDEPELGPHPDDVRIASISLGARRVFRMCERHGERKLDFALGEGDLLVMGGTTQRHWVHEVPRTKKPVGPRLNLTFRVVRPTA